MDIVYHVESPQDHDRIRFGCIKAEGWAFSVTDEELEIYIMMGRKKIIPTQRKEREDVGEAHPAAGLRSLYSGFSCLIDLPPRERGRAQLLKIYAKRGEEEMLLGRYLLEAQDTKETEFHRRLRFAGAYLGELAVRRRLPEGVTARTAVTKAKNLLAYGDTDKEAGRSRRAAARTGSSRKETDPYEIWMKKNAYTESARRRDEEALSGLQRKPLISVIMPAYESDLRYLSEAIESVKNQVYPKWELIVADDCSKSGGVRDCVLKYAAKDPRIRYCRTERNLHISGATNFGVKNSSGEYLAFMDHDDLLAENALMEIARQIDRDPSVMLLYSDDDKIGPEGRRYDPQFKPEYSPELLLSYMYFSHLLVINRVLFDGLGGFRKGYEGSQDHDLALRAVEKTDRIAHIPKILYHWRAAEGSTARSTDTKPYSITAGMKAVSDAVKRRKIPAVVTQPQFAEKNKLGIYALKYQPPEGEAPLVTIVIPSKNHKELLERCVESIRTKSSYPNYELLIVDNESDEKETLKYLAGLSCRVIREPNAKGSFNFSQLVNAGVRAARGEYVILLNNDTEVIAPDWIEQLLLYLRTEGVGAAGAKLLYSDKTVQHAGVVLRMGNDLAGHAFKLISQHDGGYLSYAKVARNYSAVTGACLMTSRKLYLEEGGFDEENFAVSYNDVDFCLRLRKKGYRIVYSPEALLYHHEGKSRGVEQSGHYSDPAEEYRFYTKHIGSRSFQDPYYNPNLSYQDEGFRLECGSVFPTERRELKVLLITHNLNYEGAPLVQFLAARNLQKKGCTFTILVSEDGLLRKDYEEAGIRVIVENVNALRNRLEFADFRRELSDLAARHDLGGFDLIYTNTIESFWGVTLGEMLHVPTIFGIHESVDYRSYFHALRKEYQEEFEDCFRKATKVLYVSRATAGLYRELDTFNTAVIRNGIETGRIVSYKKKVSREEARSAFGLGAGSMVITVVGTVCERKGQLYFVKAASLLRQQYPSVPFVFQIVGAKPSPYLDFVKEYVRGNQLESCVRIIPYASNAEMFRYYRASDIFVCSSIEESSPLVLLEAMAFGVPIVSTGVFGIPEILRNGQDAILVGDKSEQELFGGIRRLLDDRRLGKRLARNAWYRLQTFFTAEQMVDQYDYLFQSVADEGENRIYERTKENS